MNLTAKISVGLIGVILISGCARRPYEPVVDGPQGFEYQRDLAYCRSLAKRRQSSGDSTASNVVVGGAIGGISGGFDGAAIGVGIGGLLGSLDDSSRLRKKRAHIVYECLLNRGHNVIG